MDRRGITVSVATWCLDATCEEELAQRINRLERDNMIPGLCYGDTVDDRGGVGAEENIPSDYTPSISG